MKAFEMNDHVRSSKGMKKHMRRECIIGITISLIVIVITIPLIYFTSRSKTANASPITATTKPVNVKHSMSASTLSTSSTLATTALPLLQRFDCYPDLEYHPEQITKAMCDSRNCIFASTDQVTNGGPRCHFPSGYGFKVAKTQQTNLGFRAELTTVGRSPFGGDLNTVLFEVEERGANLLRFKVNI